MFDFEIMGDQLIVGRASVLRIDEENWYSVRPLPSGNTVCIAIHSPISRQNALAKLVANLRGV